MKLTLTQPLLLFASASTSANPLSDMRRFWLHLQISDKIHCSSHTERQLGICISPRCKSFWLGSLEGILDQPRIQEVMRKVFSNLESHTAVC